MKHAKTFCVILEKFLFSAVKPVKNKRKKSHCLKYLTGLICPTIASMDTGHVTKNFLLIFNLHSTRVFKITKSFCVKSDYPFHGTERAK